jgi:N-acetylmuramoyl-L-alanine amidase
VTGKLAVGQDGRVTGPADIKYNSPWPCVNGTSGSGTMAGVLMHTMAGDLPGTISWFNNPQAQASAHFGIAQDGEIWQFGPIGKGWIAWHAAAANQTWYGIEHADDGNPANPLTAAQITASAQLAECLSAFAGFPLHVSDSPSVKGYGWHGMGGTAWGNHPDCPGSVRRGQRAQIIALAAVIRSGTSPPSGPYRHVAQGNRSLEQIAAARGTTPAHLLQVTAGALTEADVAAVAGLPLPAGWVWYSTDP